MSGSPAARAAGNLAWLIAPQGRRRAIVLAPQEDALAEGLNGHFDTVQRLEPLSALGELGAAGQKADLIAIARLETCADRDRLWLPGILPGVRDRLAPGGLVLITLANPLWGRDLSRGWPSRRQASLGAVQRTVLRAGLRVVASYYLQPYPDQISSVIPVWGRAAGEYERIQFLHSRLARLRAPVARWGLHQFLYPGCACVGSL